MNQRILSIVALFAACFVLGDQAIAAQKPAKTKARAKSKEQIVKEQRRLRILDARKSAGEGLALFKAKRFSEAVDKFEESAQSYPLDPSVHYYMGLSALYQDDYKTSEKAFARAIVASDPKSTYSLQARQCFESKRKEFDLVKPYSCVFQSNKFWHWSKQRMPIKIYLSAGLELPNKYSGSDLTPDKLKEVGSWLRNSRFVKSLKPMRHYREEYGSAVKNGLAEWAFADTEGILKYTIIDDITRADIIVLYCSTLASDAPGLTTYSERVNEPVVIQFPVEYFYKLPLNLWPVIIRSIACHEFGHAFGLQDSDFKRDIMFPTDKIQYVHRNTDQSGPNIVTKSDAATLRALYELPAPIMK